MRICSVKQHRQRAGINVVMAGSVPGEAYALRAEHYGGC